MLFNACPNELNSQDSGNLIRICLTGRVMIFVARDLNIGSQIQSVCIEGINST